MKNIVVAHGHTSIEVLHSLTPMILASRNINDWKWSFIDYRLSNIFNKEGDILILVRKYHDGKTNDSDIIRELLDLRKNFSKIVYFDDSAAASIAFFCAFPYVDQYWKRSKLINENLYKKKFYGGHVYSDFYHQKFGIEDKSQMFFNPVATNETDMNKLKISWNIGIGVYPLNSNDILDKYYQAARRFITSLTLLPSIYPIHFLIKKYFLRMKTELKKEVIFKNKNTKFSSRFMDVNYRNSIGFQRNLLIRKTKENKNFLVGHKAKREFTKETFTTYGLLSPFGWGEICYRDFEAAIGGSILIKPDMSHISTWPNIYSRDMYEPLQWDFTNLNNLNVLFDEPKKCEDTVNRARKEYLDSLNNVVTRCINMIERI